MSYQDFEFFKSVIDIQFLWNFAFIMGKNEQVLKAKASDTYFLLFWKLANIAIGKPQLENLCFDRAMDTIYQHTYGSDKSRKIRQIIGIFHQIYTLCII